MKALTRILAIAAVASSALVTANVASADLSYNIGFASEYYYRGILQKDSSASAGIDYDYNGFYVGTWAADVGDGAEVDVYFGYGIETDQGFSGSVGFTGYYYTGQFDDTYQEVNFNVGYKILGIEYSVGEYDNFKGDDQDYQFLAGTVTLDNGLYATVGAFMDDFDGEYVELGWGTTVSELDLGIAIIINSDDLSDECSNEGVGCTGSVDDRPSTGEAVVFTIGKTF